ncbi:MAG: hypothetical protein ABIK09_02165 [Pseudomonadota bacterium]
MRPLLWFALFVVGLFLIIRRLARWDPADFTVQVGPRGRVKLTGEVPGFPPSAIHDLVEDLKLPDGARIVGLLDRGDWRVRAQGVDKFMEQRIRNVLFTRLPR